MTRMARSCPPLRGPHEPMPAAPRRRASGAPTYSCEAARARGPKRRRARGAQRPPPPTSPRAACSTRAAPPTGRAPPRPSPCAPRSANRGMSGMTRAFSWEPNQDTWHFARRSVLTGVGFCWCSRACAGAHRTPHAGRNTRIPSMRAAECSVYRYAVSVSTVCRICAYSLSRTLGDAMTQQRLSTQYYSSSR